MAFDRVQLRTIYDRTDGYCHICHRKVFFRNHGVIGARGAWEVEHSRPRSNGGTDHGNNLYSACTKCNREKSDCTSRTARRWNGTTRAPRSKAEKAAERQENAAIGALVGGTIGAIAGPLGAIAGAYIGGQIGSSVQPAKV